MAIIKRKKSTIYGLDSDLQALNLVDTNETNARILADTGLDNKISDEVTLRGTEVTRVEGIITTNKNAIEQSLASEVSTLDNKINTAITDASSGSDTVQNNLDTAVASINVTTTDLRADLNNTISNTDPAALDSLTEVVAAFEAADSNLDSAITDLAADRTSKLAAAVALQDQANAEHNVRDGELQDDIDAEVTARTTAVSNEETARIAGDALAVKKADNLSDLADAAISRTNLGVDSSAEVTEKVRVGGSLPILETVVVSNDTITITNIAKQDIIANYSTVRHIDANGVASDIPVSVNVAGSKVYNLYPDETGEFDGLNVSVQYDYIPVG